MVEVANSSLEDHFSQTGGELSELHFHVKDSEMIQSFGGCDTDLFNWLPWMGRNVVVRCN